MNEYESKSIKLGTKIMIFAIIGNFCPVAYMAIVKGIMPSAAQIMTIWGLAAATFGISWIVQPISYYGALGAGGSYIGWISGSVGDMKMPSIQMAQKVSGYEAGTPEGNCISTIAVVGSIFTSFTVVTVFTLIGAAIIPHLPEYITGSFSYVLPSLFAAIYVQMAPKSMKGAIPTLIFAYIILVMFTKFGWPTGFITLCVVILGMVFARVAYGLDNKTEANEGSK